MEQRSRQKVVAGKKSQSARFKMPIRGWSLHRVNIAHRAQEVRHLKVNGSQDSRWNSVFYDQVRAAVAGAPDGLVRPFDTNARRYSHPTAVTKGETCQTNLARDLLAGAIEFWANTGTEKPVLRQFN